MEKLLEKIIHTIIPHPKNRNVPHILTETSVATLLVVIFALFIFTDQNVELARKLNLTATVYPAVLADLTNKDRAGEGVAELRWSDTLAAAARMKAQDMLENGYFAHTSPAGLTPWHWLTILQYNFRYAGENLAIRFNDTDSVESAWLNSPTHKANIVSDKFSEIGIAAVDGIFEGANTTIVVEFFGAPSMALASSTPPPPPVSPSPSPVPPPETPPQVVVNPPVAPVVAGTETEPKTPKTETIEEEKTFVAVKNVEAEVKTEAIPPPVHTENVETRSTWYERLLVKPGDAVKSIYLSIVALILTAMVLMSFKQYERHHLKHFSMGLGLLVIVAFLLYFVGPSVAFFA
jgi:hypothetical protein